MGPLISLLPHTSISFTLREFLKRPWTIDGKNITRIGLNATTLNYYFTICKPEHSWMTLTLVRLNWIQCIQGHISFRILLLMQLVYSFLKPTNCDINKQHFYRKYNVIEMSKSSCYTYHHIVSARWTIMIIKMGRAKILKILYSDFGRICSGFARNFYDSISLRVHKTSKFVLITAI